MDTDWRNDCAGGLKMKFPESKTYRKCPKCGDAARGGAGEYADVCTQWPTCKAPESPGGMRPERSKGGMGKKPDDEWKYHYNKWREIVHDPNAHPADREDGRDILTDMSRDEEWPERDS